jgi:hypothetical protein
VLFGCAFVGFLLTIFFALVIYERNASHLETEIRGMGPKDFKLAQLDRFLKWSFMFAVICAILASTISIGRKQMAESVKTTTSPQNVQESLRGIENLPPEQDRSLLGVENLKPAAVEQRPATNPTTTTGTTESPSVPSQAQTDKPSPK